MIGTDKEPVVIDLRDDMEELRALTERAAALARDLWREAGDDGELSLRLVDVSHALHRAIVSLSDEVRIG